jgi:GH24 family phage-related lysozyme (muramidase)
MGRKISKNGLELIKGFEGLYLTAYLDIVGVPTIGFGCTEGVTKEDVANKRTITEQEAIDMMMKELDRFEKGVTKYVTIPINQNQFDALVSFSYNVGLGALQKSTLLKILNAGDISGAAEQFLRWNKAGGVEVKGLTRRRQAERSLFLKSETPPAGLLPDGPSEEEINKKLADIEKDLK